MLSMGELLSIAQVLSAVRSLKEWHNNCTSVKNTSIDYLFEELLPNKFLEEKINFSIKSEEEMQDNASQTLYNIRRKIVAKSSSIRENLDRIVKGPSSKYLQEAIVTQRDGRFVVPVKTEFKGEISGIVHDSSSTGATLFIEPMSVVEANNEIRVLKNKEAEEINRILCELSAQVCDFADTIKKSPRPVSYMVVNEAGASVYSASKLGAEEFPDFDVSVRSAVSIARRLQDPLSELVKIEPKSIGVGQYQHDVPPARLEESLSGVVEDCVNSVGVDLNTASVSLLKYISGVTSATAKNIVAYREENGGFNARTDLKKVKGLGPKAYQQCAGFLRIPGGKTPLDNTGVHPESYDAAKKLLDLFGYSQKDVADKGASGISGKVQEYGLPKAAEECGVGTPTLVDIMGELEKPGRDIRDELPKPMLRTDIMDMNDLREGMELTGTVRNVIDFGVFVDIGVHQDGLVHISRITDRFIKHPAEVLKVGDIVDVYVMSVDVNKKRISLSIKPLD